MRLTLSLAAAITGFVALPAYAVDHDNLDSSRPLRIEDAESIAFRERAIEYGFAPAFRKGGSGRLGLSAELLYGVALNTHLSLDVDPTLGNGRFDVGNVGVGIFRNLNRETLQTPAFAVRADAYLPTGRGASGLGLRVRGIASRTFGQYNRLHVNLDGNFRTSPGSEQRAFAPALTVGVSRSLGYPRRFDCTGVAELGVRASDERNRGAVFSAGVGVRQQVTVRSVFDAGLTSDFAATKGGAARDTLRLVAGYSTQF